MDRIIVQEKLAALRDHVEWIEEIIPDRHEGLVEDRVAKESVVLNFIQAVQVSVDIAMHAVSKAGNERPATMRDAFDSLHRMEVISDTTSRAMQDAVHIRNIATHSYVKLDLRILHTACTRHLVAFRSFATQVGQYAGLVD